MAARQAPDDGLQDDREWPAVWDALLDGFLGYLGGTLNYSENTVRAYGTDLASFFAWASAMGVDACHASHRDYRRYLAALDAEGYARHTVNRHLSAVRTFCEWLVREGVSQNNAAIFSVNRGTLLLKTCGTAPFWSCSMRAVPAWGS